MKYRIEIWQYHAVQVAYESDNAQECREWIRSNGYGYMAENAECYIAVYENGKHITITALEWLDEKPKMTNFEWLKSLSEQDMAELLASQENITDLIRMTCLETHIDDCEEGCIKCWLKWLQEERQEHNDES